MKRPRELISLETKAMNLTKSEPNFLPDASETYDKPKRRGKPTTDYESAKEWQVIFRGILLQTSKNLNIRKIVNEFSGSENPRRYKGKSEHRSKRSMMIRE